jgi:hypothetical protein
MSSDVRLTSGGSGVALAVAVGGGMVAVRVGTAVPLVVATLVATDVAISVGGGRVDKGVPGVSVCVQAARLPKHSVINNRKKRRIISLLYPQILDFHIAFILFFLYAIKAFLNFISLYIKLATVQMIRLPGRCRGTLGCKQSLSLSLKATYKEGYLL